MFCRLFAIAVLLLGGIPRTECHCASGDSSRSCAAANRRESAAGPAATCHSNRPACCQPVENPENRLPCEPDCGQCHLILSHSECVLPGTISLADAQSAIEFQVEGVCTLLANSLASNDKTDYRSPAIRGDLHSLAQMLRV